MTFFWLGPYTAAVDEARKHLTDLGSSVQVHAAPTKKKLRTVVAHTMAVAQARSVVTYPRPTTQSTTATGTTATGTTATGTTATGTTSTENSTTDTTATETITTDTNQAAPPAQPATG